MNPKHPNILFITTDEHRFDALGCYGNDVIRTPNIDAIAARGVRFERGYVQNPMCMPSRMAMMTGRYCSENGCNINCTGIPLWEQQNTFIQKLQDNGYVTAAIGKMHMMPKWGPFGFGYLDLVEGKADANNQYIDYLQSMGMNGMQHQAKGESLPFGTHTNALPAEHTIDAFVGRRAVAWLESWDTTMIDNPPFFLWVSFSNPHFPFDPPEPYDTLYDPDEVPLPVWKDGELQNKPPQHKLQEERGYDQVTEEHLRKIVANYYGNVTLVDDQVGKILDLLSAKGLDKNTLIAFTSDHGDHLGDHRLLHKSGVTFYDISVRVPFIVSYPPLFPVGVVCEDLVETIDLAATFLDVAQIPVPGTFQGRSLVGLAEGHIADWRDDAFSEIDLLINPKMHGPNDPNSRDYVAMICTREWKYVHFPNLGIGELYDLINDPHELDNLFYDPAYADCVSQMRLRLLNRFMQNQRPYIGERTEGFREHFHADHRPPEPIPGVEYPPTVA
ncbi:MAG: sulfatase-like hydrolase/transferase [Anaerolineae bacterium]|nr:sulfatase-like hydrolase/transferase [Anaerolineae bacterium]